MGMNVKVISRIPEVKQKINLSPTQKMHQAVNAVKTQTLETLSGERSGREYMVPGTHKTYIASAPGEPPAQATGQLRQSIKTLVKGSLGTVTGQVGSNIEYAPSLEFGTKKMAARPWLKPSFEKALPMIKQILGARWL